MIREKIINFLGGQVADSDMEELGLRSADKLFFQEIALYIAISYIANTISKCEIKTLRAGEEVQDELYYRLNVSPNPNQNSSQFWNQIIERYFYSGDALVFMHKGSIYCADGFTVEEFPFGEDVYSSVSVRAESLDKSFNAGDVFYFKLDNRKVSALVRGLFNDYSEMINAAVSSYIDGASEKYKLVLENYKQGDRNFNEEFNSVIKGHLETFINSRKAVYPQFRGQDLRRMDAPGSTASASDVTAMRKEVFEITSQAFKIPLSMMQGNITNMGEIVKVYLSFCVDPVAQMISEEITRKTTTMEEWLRGDRVIVDTSAINHIDLLDVADKADKLIASGVACIDDVRKRLGMQPLETDYSTAHYLTKNYAPVDEAASVLGGGDNNGETI